MNLIKEYRKFIAGREVDYCYVQCGRYHAVFQDKNDVTVSRNNITMSSPRNAHSIAITDTQSA